MNAPLDLADDLCAQGSGVRARQTKRSPHAPEERPPTPAVNLRVDMHLLAKGLEEAGRLPVGKQVQQPKQFIVAASVETIAGRERWFVLKISRRKGHKRGWEKRRRDADPQPNLVRLDLLTTPSFPPCFQFFF